MKDMHTVYLSLGSNLGARLSNLQQALLVLGDNAGRVSQCSSVYSCPAWGFDGQEFLNICISLETSLSPEKVLEICLETESQLGRVRQDGSGYADRVLDIDLLYYDSLNLTSDCLAIPHPHIQDRRFVLKPLADIAPQLYHPTLGEDTRNLLQQCKDPGQVTKTKLKLYTQREDALEQLQFLAVEGNIGAGKTTLASQIAHDFNAKLVLERFADNPFLPKFYEDQARYAFPLEMSFLADRHQQFREDTSQFDLFKRFMVSDYDIFKSLIFAQVTLQADEFLLYRKVFNFLYQDIRKPDIYVYLHQNTERLLEQIAKRGRKYEAGISPEYLEQINHAYLEHIRKYPDLNSLVIDVEHMDFVANNADYRRVLDQIIGHLAKRQEALLAQA